MIMAIFIFLFAVAVWMSYRVLCQVRKNEPAIWQQWGSPNGLIDHFFAGSLLVQSVVFFTRSSEFKSTETVASVRQIRVFLFLSFVAVILLGLFFRD